jgi:glucose/arabinose dehydrogenase
MLSLSAVTMPRLARVALLLALLWIVSDAPDASGATPSQLYLPLISRVEAFQADPLGGFQFATTLAALPDGGLLVGERTGRIWRIMPDGQQVAFLDLTPRVVSGHLEQGLLALVADPGFAGNGYVYAMFTGKVNRPNEIVVARYSAATNGVADPLSQAVLLSVPQTSQVHHGGGLAFGPEGLLYVGIGDGREGQSAQQPNSVRGKIVRLVAEQLPPTGAPPLLSWLDAARSVDADFYAQGLRNPWRLAFDPANGDLFIADVGELTWEEVNLMPAGRKGLNFGWPCREGPDVLSSSGPCAGKHFTPPLHVYGHSSERCAIIGGSVIRYDSLTATRRYVFGDFCSGEIIALDEAGGAWQARTLGQLPSENLLTALTHDARGRFHGATAADPGPIFRLMLPPPGA